VSLFTVASFLYLAEVIRTEHSAKWCRDRGCLRSRLLVLQTVQRSWYFRNFPSCSHV